jgi:hypothetical protein
MRSNVGKEIEEQVIALGEIVMTRNVIPARHRSATCEHGSEGIQLPIQRTHLGAPIHRLFKPRNPRLAIAEFATPFTSR